MNILGIWDGHDSGAALLTDGVVVAAVNEERLSRRKLEVRFPSASIETCLRIGGVTPADIDTVAVCGSDVAKTLARVMPSLKESYYRLRRRHADAGPLSSIRKKSKYWITELGPGPLSRSVTRSMLGRELARHGLRPSSLRVYDHHAGHAAAGACTSGFTRSLVLTIDGVGDGTSASVSVFDDGRLETIAHTPARHSPGIFFEHVTNLLNMRELEDEGKVMALANYAAPLHDNPLADVLFADGLRFRTAAPGHALHRRLRRVQWRYPNEQFARMAQDALEQACVDVARTAVRTTGLTKVVLSGGVASNIQANRLIRLLPEVDEVFVFPHMGDGGLAMGAAFLASLEAGTAPRARIERLDLGPAFGRDVIRRSLETAGLGYEEPPDLAETVAGMLLEDQVVLWFQGRMEYGPRALGYRSILARPDRPAVRDRLNLVLKRRVWYQPFCPSMLEADARRLFNDWKGAPDRFMTMAYTVSPSCRGLLAGVVGVDGTCRPQIVADDAVTPLAELLRALKRQSGIGAVLNTSFNIHSEPLVCTPEEALDVLRRSGADALAIGPFLVRAPSGSAGSAWTG